MKIISFFFFLKIIIFLDCKIFSIYEKACFRNVKLRLIYVFLNVVHGQYKIRVLTIHTRGIVKEKYQVIILR